MSIAEGSGNRLAYAREASWKDPATAAAKWITTRKLLGAGLGLDRTTIRTSEVNARRAITAIRLGTRKARATVPTELFYGGVPAAADAVAQFEDFIASWMCNVWTAAPTAIAAQTVTVGTPSAAGTIFTAGTAATNIALGMWVKISGYTGAQVANNGYYRCIAVNSLALTFATPNHASLVAGAAQGTAVVMQIMAFISPGVVVNSLAIEERQSVGGSVALVKYVLGNIADTFSLKIVPDQIVTCDFGFIGGSFGAGATAALAATAAGLTAPCADAPGAAPTTNPMTANDTLLVIMVDNAAVAVVTSLSLDGKNNLEALFPVGALNAYDIGKGDSEITGTMDLYLLDSAYWTKYDSETVFGLSIRLMDPDAGTLTTQAAGKGYAIDIPNIKMSGLSENKEKNKVILNVPFFATELLTANAKGAATTNIRISQLI
jgi:hypothetical protein